MIFLHAVPALPIEHERREPGVLQHLGWGLATIIVMLFLKAGLESAPLLRNTGVGDWIRYSTYGLMQMQLAPNGSVDDLPVAVLDISDLPQFNVGPIDRFTPLPNIKDLVGTLIDCRPKAIGIDVQISTDKRNGGNPGATRFYQWISLLDRQMESRQAQRSGRKPIPIYWGVPPEPSGDPRWNPITDRHGASLFVPEEGAQRVPLWIKPRDGEVGTLPPYLNSLSSRLSSVIVDRPKDLPGSIGWAFLRFSLSERTRGMIEQKFLVNYGPLNVLESPSVTLQTTSPVEVLMHRGVFENRLVLIGDIQHQKADLHSVPGRWHLVPGVEVHACAVYTLSRSPLYELTLLGRLALDALLSLSVMLITLVLYRFAERRVSHDRKVSRRRISRGREVSHRRIHHRMTAWVAGSVLFLMVFVAPRLFGLMWDDFLFVLFGLVLHPYVEDRLRRVPEGLKHVPQQLVDSLSHDPSESNDR